MGDRSGKDEPKNEGGSLQEYALSVCLLYLLLFNAVHELREQALVWFI